MKLVLIGGGALCLEIESYALDQARAGGPPVDSVTVYDYGTPRLAEMRTPAAAIRHLASLDGIQPAPDEEFVIALGEPEHRRRFAALLDAMGARLATIIHPQAHVAPTARVAPGTVVAPFAFVGPQARIGRHGLLNTHVSVGHDAMLGEGCVLSPHAVMGGFARAGDGCLLGTNAAILPKVSLGAWSKVSAGSVLTRDADPGSLAHGNPAQARVMFRLPQPTDTETPR